jgi:hypothetical protein
MLIEAYCKSAAMPGQRIVVSETPAAPFRPRMTVDRAW